MALQEQLTEGVFIRELKNRFLCEVMVGDEAIECYVPSSCRLENFIDLHGKRVLLLPTEAPGARTRFSLFAVPFKRNYILLNIGKVNSVVESNIKRRWFSALGMRSRVCREYKVDAYKCDLFIENTNMFLEIKSVLSLQKHAMFPTIFSRRALEQLQAISELLDKGYKAAIIIVSLNPYVEQIQIDHNTPFYNVLQLCIEKGMQFIAMSLCIHQGEVQVKKQIEIIL